MSSLKNIFITRHGHADFTADRDFERELTPRGIQMVNSTAIFIKQQNQQKDLTLQVCISSAAIRTKQTADIICKQNNIKNLETYEDLYSTSVSNWIDKLAQRNERNIVIVGHNPTFSQMVRVFTGNEIQMQPSNCAFISLEIKPDGFVYPATLNKYFTNEK